MIAGDVDEEVAEKVRKTRREKKHNKLCGCGGKGSRLYAIDRKGKTKHYD